MRKRKLGMSRRYHIAIQHDQAYEHYGSVVITYKYDLY